MEQIIEKKFKKGDFVKFVSEGLKSVSTYVWSVGVTEYVIQHPEGIELNEENKTHFEGFDTSKLTLGKKYLPAKESELELLTSAVVPEVKTEITVKPEVDQTPVEVTFRKPVLQTVYESCFMQKLSFVQSKQLIILQSGMSEEEFVKIQANLDEAIEIFKALGIEELEAP